MQAGNAHCCFPRYLETWREASSNLLKQPGFLPDAARPEQRNNSGRTARKLRLPAAERRSKKQYQRHSGKKIQAKNGNRTA
jgi:hypothetical protein